MRTLAYSSDAAFKNLWREKWINILSALSISVLLMILGGFILASYSMDVFINSWFKDFNIIVYLDNEIKVDDKENLKEFLRLDPDISSMKFVSREEALLRMEEMLGAGSSLLDSIEGNPLPSSIELKLNKDTVRPSLLKQKAEMIRQLAGVGDVQFGEKWVTSLVKASKALRALTLLIGASLLTAVIFISFSTIKILFFRRMEEIETIKMLGATRRFIRLPFQIEGIIIGALGGSISSISLYVAHHFITLRMIEIIPSLSSAFPLLPTDIFISGPAAGILLSLIGSHLAIGKIRY